MKTAAFLLISACLAIATATQEPSASSERAEAVDPDQVRAFLESIPPNLLRSGPKAWLEVFSQDPEFFMASEGGVVFADYDAARTFLEDFAKTVERIELEWTKPRVQMLAPDLALVASAYDEQIEWKAGGSIEFGGYFSGLAVRETAGWKLRHLHWSRPVSSTDSDASDGDQ
jgi:hypothetical protein